MVLACACAWACGSDADHKDVQTLHAPEKAASAAPDPFELSTGVVIDDATAALLPATTAGALTLADPQELATKLGFNPVEGEVEAKALVHLVVFLGAPVFDVASTTHFGLVPHQPITLAWLDPAAETMVLVVPVSDAAKVNDELALRTHVIRNGRAVLILGKHTVEAQHKLAKLRREDSLAASELAVMERLQFGDDASLYLGPTAHPVLARTKGLGIGITLRDDAILFRAVAAVSDTEVDPKPFTEAGLNAIGISAHEIATTPLPTHPLSVRLGTFAPAVAFGGDHVLARFVRSPSMLDLPDVPTAVDAKIREVRRRYGAAVRKPRSQLDRALGTIILATNRTGGHVIFHGAATFDHATVEDVAADAVALWYATTQSPAHAELTRLTAARELLLAHPRKGDRARANRLRAQDRAIIELLHGSPPPTTQLLDNHGAGANADLGSASGTNGEKGFLGHGTGRIMNLRIDVAVIKTDAGIPKAYLTTALRDQIPEIRQCYSMELPQKGTIEGTVKARFSIDGSGAAHHVTARGVNKRVARYCVADVIRAARFPTPAAGSARVTVGIEFHEDGR